MQKPPLFRRVNTTARGVHHNFGGEFRHDRSKLADNEMRHKSMGGKVRRGLDYTPLFRFLISKVGSDWTSIHKEAISRLDQEDPIYWLVARSQEDQREIVCVGESTYFSGLFINSNNQLQVVNPNLQPSSLNPQCKCCTHTFNGVRFTKSFDPENPFITQPRASAA